MDCNRSFSHYAHSGDLWGQVFTLDFSVHPIQCFRRFGGTPLLPTIASHEISGPSPRQPIPGKLAGRPGAPGFVDRVRDVLTPPLLDGGYDIRTVRELLGPSDVSTTMIYTHVLKRGGQG